MRDKKVLDNNECILLSFIVLINEISEVKKEIKILRDKNVSFINTQKLSLIYIYDTIYQKIFYAYNYGTNKVMTIYLLATKCERLS